MPSRKDKLIAEYGQDEADRIMSDHMKAARAHVKKPGLANVPKSRRSEIANKGWRTRRAQDETNNQISTKNAPQG